MEVQSLLSRCRELGIRLSPTADGQLKVRAPGPLPDALRSELKRRKAEVLSSLNNQETAFLGQHVPSPALDVFPDWYGLLVKSSVLGMSVWLVRCRPDGEALAQETGQPALVLDDVLVQRGHTQEEARAELLPLLITSGTVQ